MVPHSMGHLAQVGHMATRCTLSLTHTVPAQPRCTMHSLFKCHWSGVPPWPAVSSLCQGPALSIWCTLTYLGHMTNPQLPLCASIPAGGAGNAERSVQGAMSRAAQRNRAPSICLDCQARNNNCRIHYDGWEDGLFCFSSETCVLLRLL
jgi:hypothetical protein